MADKQVKQAVRFENPLMPDERLRQMYTAMVQMRMLEEYLAGRSRLRKAAPKLVSVRGEEAARASTALSLGSGDLICDCAASPGMDLLMGGELAELKRRVASPGERRVATEGDRFARRLPATEDAGERLHVSIGAAAALKAQRGGRVLVVYTEAGEVQAKRWKRTLGAAGERELPVIFVVLPELKGRASRRSGELSLRSRGWGVPGFPVDGSDAIAMYRVMQESLLRGRSDGGPALIECVAFDDGHAKEAKFADPVERLAELMIAKDAASEVWLKETREAFARRLKAAKS